MRHIFISSPFWSIKKSIIPHHKPIIIKDKVSGETVACIKPIEESEIMRIRFKPNDKERVYVDETRVTNGHWLLYKEVIGKRGILKGLKKWNTVMNGSYYQGDFMSEQRPNLNQIVPDINRGYYKLKEFSLSIPKIDVDTLKAHVVEVNGCYEIEGCLKEIDTMGVSPDYVALLSLGDVWVKSNREPIVLVEGEQVLGVVMPVRI